MLSTLRRSSISSTPECKPRGLEGRKARRFKVKQPGASNERKGTAVSTSQVDAETLLEWLLSGILPSDLTKLVDLGSGMGMLLLVAAQMLADGGSVYGIEHQKFLCEKSKELLTKYRLNADIIHGDLYALDELPITGLTHVICQSHGMPPELQYAIWLLLLKERKTIRKVAIGIGNANQEAAFYDFFYQQKLNGAGRSLRSGVTVFIPHGKTQAIHVIDTDQGFWDELQEYINTAEREALEALEAEQNVNRKRYLNTYAAKACLKFKKHRLELERRLEEETCNPSSGRKRRRFRPVNVTREHVQSNKGTF
jgi:hypothetical protein